MSFSPVGWRPPAGLRRWSFALLAADAALCWMLNDVVLAATPTSR
jgi:hypothetical protein